MPAAVPTSLDDLALERRLDALFRRWTAPGSPGCVVGIARGDRILHRKGYGLAHVEHHVPITPQTRFRIASVTKQFVTSATLMLAAEGRLDLKAAPKAYLPALPPWPVTLDQMMRNASGLPDFLELFRLGGIGLDAPLSAAEIDAAIARSHHLNFEPGARFLYCNSNFLLLGRIIEAVEGEPLGEVLARRIFRPLGMASTALTPSIDQVVPGLATGYLADGEGGIRRAAHGFPLAGEGGLVSALDDLLVWSRNWDRPALRLGDLGDRLAGRVPLGNGTANPYACGVEHGRLRGLATIGHGGLWPGYRTEFLRVPEADLAVVVIANLGSIDPYRLARAAALEVLREEPRLQPAPKPPSDAEIEALRGVWFDDEELVLFELDWRDGEPVVTRNGVPFALAARGDGWLAAERGAYEFAIRAKDTTTIEADLGAGKIVRCRNVTVRDLLPNDIAGTYVSPDAGVTWRIAPEGRKMALAVGGPIRSSGPGGEIVPIAGDAVEVRITTSWLPFEAVARLDRDGRGRPVGLTLSSARIKNLRFERLAD